MEKNWKFQDKKKQKPKTKEQINDYPCVLPYLGQFNGRHDFLVEPHVHLLEAHLYADHEHNNSESGHVEIIREDAYFGLVICGTPEKRK